MKKQLIYRGLSGFPIGIAIGFIITIFISLCMGDGLYYPAALELIESRGNELNAVIFQSVLCGIMGSIFAMSSIIWEIEDWSLAKQSGIYFIIIAVVLLPISYYANWMEHTIAGFLSYTCLFVVIFAVIWLIQYLRWKRTVKKISDHVKKSNVIK